MNEPRKTYREWRDAYKEPYSAESLAEAAWEAALAKEAPGVSEEQAVEQKKLTDAWFQNDCGDRACKDLRMEAALQVIFGEKGSTHRHFADIIFSRSALAASEPAQGEEAKDTGTVLYLALARDIIGRILRADADCDPPHDVRLRLESIIMERDRLRARPAHPASETGTGAPEPKGLVFTKDGEQLLRELLPPAEPAAEVSLREKLRAAWPGFKADCDATLDKFMSIIEAHNVRIRCAAEYATEADCLKVVQKAWYEAQRKQNRAAMHVCGEIEKYMKESKGQPHFDKAIAAAEAKGRNEGLEEAARCVETQTVGGNKAPGSASRVLLATAIRALKSQPPAMRKESTQAGGLDLQSEIETLSNLRETSLSKAAFKDEIEIALKRAYVAGRATRGGQRIDWESQNKLAQATEKKDCEKALLALAGWYPTPLEGYGWNSSWAISDLCRAIAQLREAAPAPVQLSASDCAKAHQDSKDYVEMAANLNALLRTASGKG